MVTGKSSGPVQQHAPQPACSHMFHHRIFRDVRLFRDGVVTVETDMTDIGTGSYTIIAQTAAEMMGVPLLAALRGADC